MTRLAYDKATIARAEEREECVRHPGHELQRRRQLHQERPALSGKAGALLEQSFERRTYALQLLIVRNHARNLYGEAELGRRAARPFRIRCGAVMPMKRRVDLRARHDARVPLEMRSLAFAPMRRRARNRPASGPDEDAPRHHASVSWPPRHFTARYMTKTRVLPRAGSRAVLQKMSR